MSSGTAEHLAGIVGAKNLRVGDEIGEDYRHDESLTVAGVAPAFLATPETAEQVAALLAACAERGVPVTARGSGTGLSGAARPHPDGLLISFERMAALLELDVANQVAVVQPGITLSELDEQTAAVGLTYPVYPGELSASAGGNVGTNAGGMRAVKYGVTRHNVLGLQAALPTGELIRTGGKTVKTSTGYDLTQLVIGSEGTLAVATEITLRLHPRLTHGATVLAPFADLDAVMAAVPRIVGSGLAPHILEYLDNLTLAAIAHTEKLSLGVADAIRDTAQAYLLVGLESRTETRLGEDVEAAGELLDELGALEIYVLDGAAGRSLVTAREKAFWTAKAAGAHDVIDVVVPRTAMPEFLSRAKERAQAAGGGAIGCGHAGDGNVHLAIFCADDDARHTLLHDIFAHAMALGGAISGEHGLGHAKTDHFTDLEDPVKLDLMRRLKASFDPAGILNPGVLFG